jgi:hypothetical protein
VTQLSANKDAATMVASRTLRSRPRPRKATDGRTSKPISASGGNNRKPASAQEGNGRVDVVSSACAQSSWPNAHAPVAAASSNHDDRQRPATARLLRQHPAEAAAAAASCPRLEMAVVVHSLPIAKCSAAA